MTDPSEDPDPGFDQREFLFATMRDADWSRLLHELGRFAASRVGRFRWNGPPPSPHDLAMAALEEILSDPYRWKPERRKKRLPPAECLKRYLFQAIWRDVQRIHDLLAERIRGDSVDEHGHCRLSAHPSSGPSPEESIVNQERMARLLEVWRFVRARGYGPLFWLYYVLEEKSAEIAQRLDLPVQRVWSMTQLMKELIDRHFGRDFLENGEHEDDPESSDQKRRGTA